MCRKAIIQSINHYPSLSLHLVCHHRYYSCLVSILLITCSFCILVSGSFSFSFPLTCGVPQGSVLCSILFNMCTTPLTSCMTSRSLSHHLYADDTKLFIYFTPKTFITAVTQLQDTISDISSWMIYNLILLNPS